jgi:hypothetical protein
MVIADDEIETPRSENLRLSLVADIRLATNYLDSCQIQEPLDRDGTRMAVFYHQSTLMTATVSDELFHLSAKLSLSILSLL